MELEERKGDIFNPVNKTCADSDDDSSLPAVPVSEIVENSAQQTKGLNEMEYVFSSTFDDWILKYGVLADHDLLNHSDTFVDEDGILRYTDSWQPVDIHRSEQSPSSIREELQETGCLRVPVCLHHIVPENPSAAASAHRVVNISFLMNFRALWEYLEADGTDELLEYAPLFRMYVELYFHIRTTYILMAVAGYDLLIHIIVDCIYPGYPVSLFILDNCQLVFEVLFYLALANLFKGSLFASTVPPALKREEPINHHKQRRHEHRKFTLHWTSSFRQVIHRSIDELFSLWDRNPQHQTIPPSKVNKPVPFYELLNISLKFLSKHSNNVGDKLQLNRKSHNIKLLMILCLLPLYYIVITFVPATAPYQQYLEICDSDGADSLKCLNSKWTFLLSLGYATYITRKYIFSSAVLLSLTGLAFGAEIAHSLTDSWIYRFGPLRRLGALNTDDMPDQSQSQGQGQGQGVLYEEFDATASMKSSLSGLGPGLGSSRPSVFRQSLAERLSLEQTATRPVRMPSKLKFGAVSAVEVMPYVQRDSYEHYLFLREFMSIASRTWSAPILTFVFFAVFLMVTFSFMLVMYIRNVTPVEWVYYTVYMLIRLTVLIIYPVLSLAHANAYVYALQEQFLIAAPEDFVALGGRDAWLDFLVKVPAIWTVYGMWVTWDRLTGILWTIVAGVGAVGISVASANL